MRMSERDRAFGCEWRRSRSGSDLTATLSGDGRESPEFGVPSVDGVCPWRSRRFSSSRKLIRSHSCRMCDLDDGLHSGGISSATAGGVGGTWCRDIPLPLVRVWFNALQPQLQAPRATVRAGLTLEREISQGTASTHRKAHPTLTFFCRQLRHAKRGSPRSEEPRAAVFTVEGRFRVGLGRALAVLAVSLGDMGT